MMARKIATRRDDERDPALLWRRVRPHRWCGKNSQQNACEIAPLYSMTLPPKIGRLSVHPLRCKRDWEK
jgi:hypothetical protein